MRLQRQMCNGEWMDCNERTEYFLGLCIKFNGLSREECIVALTAGRELRRNGNDWYSYCRDGEFADKKSAAIREAQKQVKMVMCDCGHRVPQNSVMQASMGTSCPDCYDRMSN